MDAVFACWQFIPFVALLVLSSIKSIPQSFLDAARVDGASPWKVFTRVVLPITSPVIIIVAMIRFIDAFKIFDVVFVMTQGGPVQSTTTVVYNIYENAFRYFQMGYASAMSVVLFLIILFFTFIQLRVARR